jgi:hypothetical protein
MVVTEFIDKQAELTKVRRQLGIRETELRELAREITRAENKGQKDKVSELLDKVRVTKEALAVLYGKIARLEGRA